METLRRYSRRTFVAWVGGASAGFYLFGRVPGLSAPVALAQLAGGTLDPANVSKFVTPLLIPPVMPRRTRSASAAARPSTTTRSRCGSSSSRSSCQPPEDDGLGLRRQDGTEQARPARPQCSLAHDRGEWNRPVRVKWINELVDASGNYLPHLLPVDPTLHWANPPGGIHAAATCARVRRDAWSSIPVLCRSSRTCTAPWESPTTATATPKPGICPRRATSPPATQPRGRGTTSSPAKRAAPTASTWGPGFATFQYPNEQPRLDDLVPRPRARHDTPQRLRRSRRLLPHPRRSRRRLRSPRHAERLARRRFRAQRRGRTTSSRRTRPTTRSRSPSRIARSTLDGSLFYPDTRAFFDEIVSDFIPDGEFSPIWNPEFFGNTIMVNGNTWPFLTVEQQRYRFRFLNGCQSRFLILDFAQ